MENPNGRYCTDCGLYANAGHWVRGRLLACFTCASAKTCASLCNTDIDNIFISGDVPGVLEDNHGIAVLGDTGELFDRCCRKAGVDLFRGYITHLIKCHTTNTPKIGQYNACIPWWQAECNQFPNYKNIIPLGSSALKHVAGLDKITTYQGKLAAITTPHTWLAGKTIFPMYSPSYIKRDGGIRKGMYIRQLSSLVTGVKVKETLGTYRIVNTIEDWNEMIAELESAKYISFDLENFPLKPFYSGAKVLSIGFSTKPGTGWCVPWNHDDSPWDEEWRTNIGLPKIKEILQNDTPKTGMNIKHELIWTMYHWGFEVNNFVYDTMLADFLIFEERPHSLNALIEYNTTMPHYWIELDEYIPVKGKDVNYGLLPGKILFPYNAADCDAVLRVGKAQAPEMTQAFLNILQSFLVPAMYTFARMECQGQTIDMERLQELSDEYVIKISAAIKKLRCYPQVQKIEDANFNNPEYVRKMGYYANKLSKAQGYLDLDAKGAYLKREELEKHKKFKAQALKGIESTKTKAQINFNSDPQVRALLFGDTGGFNLKPTVLTEKTEQPSVKVEVLEEFNHPFCQDLVGFKKAKSLVDNFFYPCLNTWTQTVDGKIHSTYNMHIAVSGRTSSREPNTQNFTELVREVVIPDKGDDWVLTADQSQIELRILAIYSQDSELLRIYNTVPIPGEPWHTDVHIQTAAKMFDMRPEDVTSEARTAAKAYSFGIIYGKSAWAISQELDFTFDEAKQLLKEWFTVYKGVRRWIDSIEAHVKKYGEVTSLLGRVRRLPMAKSGEPKIQAHALRQAVNSPIQGLASDITVANLTTLSSVIYGKSSRFRDGVIMTTKSTNMVHDELVFSTSDKAKVQLAKVVKGVMETPPWNFIKGVPLVADIELGRNYKQLEYSFDGEKFTKHAD
jgi:DNA polymerase-1